MILLRDRWILSVCAITYAQGAFNNVGNTYSVPITQNPAVYGQFPHMGIPLNNPQPLPVTGTNTLLQLLNSGAYKAQPSADTSLSSQASNRSLALAMHTLVETMKEEFHRLCQMPLHKDYNEMVKLYSQFVNDPIRIRSIIRLPLHAQSDIERYAVAQASRASTQPILLPQTVQEGIHKTIYPIISRTAVSQQEAAAQFNEATTVSGTTTPRTNYKTTWQSFPLVSTPILARVLNFGTPLYEQIAADSNSIDALINQLAAHKFLLKMLSTAQLNALRQLQNDIASVALATQLFAAAGEDMLAITRLLHTLFTDYNALLAQISSGFTKGTYNSVCKRDNVAHSAYVCLAARLFLHGLVDCVAQHIGAYITAISICDACILCTAMLMPSRIAHFPAFISVLYSLMDIENLERMPSPTPSDASSEAASHALSNGTQSLSTEQAQPTKATKATEPTNALPVYLSRRQASLNRQSAATNYNSEQTTRLQDANETHAILITSLSTISSMLSKVSLAPDADNLFTVIRKCILQMKTTPHETASTTALLWHTIHVYLGIGSPLKLLPLLTSDLLATASWPCWITMLTMMQRTLSQAIFLPFLVTRTPPQYAARTIHSSNFPSLMKQTVFLLWLVADTPHVAPMICDLRMMLTPRNVRKMCMFLVHVSPQVYRRVPQTELESLVNWILESRYIPSDSAFFWVLLFYMKDVKVPEVLQQLLQNDNCVLALSSLFNDLTRGKLGQRYLIDQLERLGKETPDTQIILQTFANSIRNPPHHERTSPSLTRKEACAPFPSTSTVTANTPEDGPEISTQGTANHTDEQAEQPTQPTDSPSSDTDSLCIIDYADVISSLPPFFFTVVLVHVIDRYVASTDEAYAKHLFNVIRHLTSSTQLADRIHSCRITENREHSEEEYFSGEAREDIKRALDRFIIFATHSKELMENPTVFFVIERAVLIAQHPPKSLPGTSSNTSSISGTEQMALQISEGEAPTADGTLFNSLRHVTMYYSLSLIFSQAHGTPQLLLNYVFHRAGIAEDPHAFISEIIYKEWEADRKWNSPHRLEYSPPTGPALVSITRLVDSLEDFFATAKVIFDCVRHHFFHTSSVNGLWQRICNASASRGCSLDEGRFITALITHFFPLRHLRFISPAVPSQASLPVPTDLNANLAPPITKKLRLSTTPPETTE